MSDERDEVAEAEVASWHYAPHRTSLTDEERFAILRSHGIEPDPVIEAYKRDVDRSLLRENLKLTPDERLRRLQAFSAAMARSAAANRARR
jgi:hypothetical protein